MKLISMTAAPMPKTAVDLTRTRIVQRDFGLIAVQGDEHAKPGLGRRRQLALGRIIQRGIVNGANAKQRICRQQLQIIRRHWLGEIQVKLNI